MVCRDSERDMLANGDVVALLEAVIYHCINNQVYESGLDPSVCAKKRASWSSRGVVFRAFSSLLPHYLFANVHWISDFFRKTIFTLIF